MEMYILSAAEQQASYFKTFVQQLVEKFHPLQLFCFSKSSVSTETAGCFKNQHNTHLGNYFLLLVTETNTRIDHEVQEFSNLHFKNGKISILCHGQEAISEAIKGNNRFFVTVYTEGQLLYSHDGMSNFDFARKFISTESAKKAQRQYDHRMPLAEGFLRGACECLSKHDYNVSTFMLHQVVEQCCILLIGVHLDYRSEIHNLLRMLRLCSAFSEQPIKTFLSGSPDDERLFNLLMKSYSGSRYGSGFSVSQEDAQSLYKRISLFVKLSKEMCGGKILKLERQALLQIELARETEVNVI